MSDTLGTVTYDQRSENGQYLGMMGYHEKRYSEETARSIDTEVRKILDEAHESALRIIREKYVQVEHMAQMLIEFETLDAEDIKKIANNEWNMEEKRLRLKKEEELHKRKPVSPPASSSGEPRSSPRKEPPRPATQDSRA